MAKKSSAAIQAKRPLPLPKPEGLFGPSSWIWYPLGAAVLGAAIFGFWKYSNPPPPDNEPSPIAKNDESPLRPKRETPRLNPRTPPGPAPEGMVWVPGGEFWMGVEEDILGEPDAPHDIYADARHVHLVYVDGFWMDATEVTNAQFAEFVKATGYLTVAEQKPDSKEFPNADPSALKPFSIVFKKPESKVRNLWAADAERTWWDLSFGADWKHPEGPKSDIKGREKHPAVHICWEDAVAYCKWAGKRLPTEAEWEFAARGGLDRAPYVWGDEPLPEGKYLGNWWQGEFPAKNTKADGFEGTAPVASFPPNGYGLHDMAGNVWEWCDDWYQKKHYLDVDRARGLKDERAARNPQGPETGFDPNEPDQPKRVQRGGSFLCGDNYCRRYVPGARGKGEVRSAANHVGFRCAMDAKK